MSNLTQNLANPNNQALVIGGFSIRQDDDGRYCINDLHKASGSAEKHKPFNFMRNQQTKDLIIEIENENMMLKSEHHKTQAVNTIKGKGLNQGTFVVKELVYAYAMWVSAKFHLMVIRAYDAMVMQNKINEKKTISSEQQVLMHKIVARRSEGDASKRAEMWARHNNHFNIPCYNELLEVHFPESIHYLETMELKSTKKIEQDSAVYKLQATRLAEILGFAQGVFNQLGDLSSILLERLDEHTATHSLACAIAEKADTWADNCSEEVKRFNESQPKEKLIGGGV